MATGRRRAAVHRDRPVQPARRAARRPCGQSRRDSTAALCASPDAEPDPARRWWAAVVAGGVYVVFGLLAGAVTAFVGAAPPVVIEAVAGLACWAFGGADPRRGRGAGAAGGGGDHLRRHRLRPGIAGHQRGVLGAGGRWGDAGAASPRQLAQSVLIFAASAIFRHFSDLAAMVAANSAGLVHSPPRPAPPARHAPRAPGLAVFSTAESRSSIGAGSRAGPSRLYQLSAGIRESRVRR